MSRVRQGTAVCPMIFKAVCAILQYATCSVVIILIFAIPALTHRFLLLSCDWLNQIAYGQPTAIYRDINRLSLESYHRPPMNLSGIFSGSWHVMKFSSPLTAFKLMLRFMFVRH